MTGETPPTRRRALSREESLGVLRAMGWGTLAVAEGDVPVAVPTAYALDGERVYLTMTDGRKQRALAGNAHLCLTVADVRSLGAWRSVQVIGRARWLVGARERSAAIEAFVARERPEGFRLTERDAVLLAASHLVEVEIDELHGFVAP